MSDEAVKTNFARPRHKVMKLVATKAQMICGLVSLGYLLAKIYIKHRGMLTPIPAMSGSASYFGESVELPWTYAYQAVQSL